MNNNEPKEDYFYEGGITEMKIYSPEEFYTREEVSESDLIKSVRGNL